MQQTKQKRSRKAFTIVELVIVIAVIAILAAVLIPTFSSVIRKANLSKDQQMVRNMNTDLAIESVNNEMTYPADAITRLYGAGYNQGKLSAYTENCHYAYSFENNMFYLIDGTDVTFPNSDVSLSSLWGLYTGSNADNIDGVTKYIALTPVVKSSLFQSSTADGVFDESGTEYTFDLNKLYINVENPTSTIKVQNGYIVASSTSSTDSKIQAADGSNISDMTMAEIGKSSTDGSNSNNIFTATDATTTSVRTEEKDSSDNVVGVTFKNAVVDLSGSTEGDNKKLVLGSTETSPSVATSIKTVTFENCLFTQKVIANVQSGEGYTFTFKNCTFSGILGESNGDGKGKSWALTLEEGANNNKNKFIVEDCIFINCDRGICFSSITTGSVVDGCTFYLNDHTENKDNAIQLSSTANWATTENESGTRITITNNNFNQCYAAVILHDSLYCQNKDAKSTLGAIQYYEHFATISGNNYSGLSSSRKVIEDIGTFDNSGNLASAYSGYATNLAETIKQAVLYLNNSAD